MATWKGPTIGDISNYTMCFACGRENPIGLKVSFRQEGEGAAAEFTPEECHQGWPGVVHGGIITTLLDEAMAYAAIFKGIYCVTAKMEARLRSAAPPGEKWLISGRLISAKGKLAKAEACITLEDGTPVAEGRATMYIIEKGKNER